MTFKFHFVLWCIFVFQRLFSADSIYTNEKGKNGSDHKLVRCEGSDKSKIITADVGIDESLFDYIQMIKNLSGIEQARLLIKNIPENVDEALELLVREILLYQKIFLEQIKAVEAMKTSPSEHVLLALHFQKFGYEPFVAYRNAKLQVAWCNFLIRYIGWITRNPDKQKQKNIDRLYEMLFIPYRSSLKDAEKGFEHILDHVQGRHLPGYALLVCKCREANIKPSNIRQTVWFHDYLTPSLRFYSTTAHILQPFITESTSNACFQRPENDSHFGEEYSTLYKVSGFKIEFRSRKSGKPSLKLIADSWTEMGNMDAYQVTRDWRDETVTDSAFEKSFMVPIGLNSVKKDQNLIKVISPHSKQLSKGSKGKNIASKKKPKKKAATASNSQSVLPDAISSSVIDIKCSVLEAPPIRLEDSKSKAAVPFPYDEKLEIVRNRGESSESLCTVNASSHNDMATPSTSLSSGPEIKSEEADSCSSKDDEFEENWEEQVKQDAETRKKYALEKKMLNRSRRVIKQEEKDRIESAHRSRIFTRLSAPSSSSSSSKGGKASQPTNVIRLDSTELCLAYPDSYSLFLSNKNICSAKAKKYQWFFDPSVTIKQKHMDFLCVLFGLESGKSRLTFESMAKAFWAIEKCFNGEQTIKDFKRTNFEWSHRFEINNVLVTPIKKDVHPEHKSSRFNHSEALALFNSGGFDPRFFTPLE